MLTLSQNGKTKKKYDLCLFFFHLVINNKINIIILF